MKSLYIIFVIGLLPIVIMAQDQKDIAASKGLEKFKKLTLLQRQKENLVNASDTASLALGQALQTAVVSLDMLKTYKSGQSAAALIKDINEFIYPVVNGKNKAVSGTVTIGKKGEIWAATRVGADKQVMMAAADSLGVPGRSYKLVKILALHLSFLSYTDGGAIMFIPLQNDAQRGITKGKTLTAEAALEKYVKAANDYNGLPM
jgi:hypothetical protein